MSSVCLGSWGASNTQKVRGKTTRPAPHTRRSTTLQNLLGFSDTLCFPMAQKRWADWEAQKPSSCPTVLLATGAIVAGSEGQVAGETGPGAHHTGPVPAWCLGTLPCFPDYPLPNFIIWVTVSDVQSPLWNLCKAQAHPKLQTDRYSSHP